MNKKYKLKKSAIIVISIIFILIIALILSVLKLIKNKSYSIEYNIDSFGISENYDAKEKLYYYEITYDGVDYNFIYESKHLKGKKMLTDIEVLKDEDYTCLVVNDDQIKTSPLCSNNNTLIDANLVSSSLKEKLNLQETTPNETTYRNYKLYNNEENLLLWSYKGFNYLANSDISFIELFNKDIYDIPHATKINNYIFIPNYEQPYNFNEAYIINLDEQEVEKWSLDYEISFDSYILGTHDKSIYLVDNKNKIEYELVPYKQKMRIVGTSRKQGIIYKNGKEEKISLTKLTTSEQSFTYKTNYHYILKDNKLYLSYLDSKHQILITNNDVSSIIYTNKDTVYYLVNDTLYKYTLSNGEQKIITYSEWSRNYQNLIFIK